MCILYKNECYYTENRSSAFNANFLSDTLTLTFIDANLLNKYYSFNLVVYLHWRRCNVSDFDAKPGCLNFISAQNVDSIWKSFKSDLLKWQGLTEDFIAAIVLIWAWPKRISGVWLDLEVAWFVCDLYQTYKMRPLRNLYPKNQYYDRCAVVSTTNSSINSTSLQWIPFWIEKGSPKKRNQSLEHNKCYNQTKQKICDINAHENWHIHSRLHAFSHAYFYTLVGNAYTYIEYTKRFFFYWMNEWELPMRPLDRAWREKHARWTWQCWKKKSERKKCNFSHAC